MIYPALHDGRYTDLRKNLLHEKGGDSQREFLEATRTSESFVSFMDERVGLEEEATPLAQNAAGFQEDNDSFEMLSVPLTEKEFKDMPKPREKELFEKWWNLTPVQASEENFWGHLTLEHIRVGIIQSPYLAANGGDLPGGLDRIDKALTGKDRRAIDSAVRTILRRLGGLPEARGARSVYSNCPFARAWWRGYVVHQVCESTDANPNKVVKTLRASQEYWEQLISLVISRNSVLGDTKVRTALIWALSELKGEKGKEALFLVKTLKQISRQIGVRLAWQELAVFDVEELKDIMEREFLPRFV